MLKEINIEKYHINIFSTNLVAIVLSIMFVRSYIAKGISIINFFLVLVLLLLVLMCITYFILHPRKHISRIFPTPILFSVNTIIAIIMGFIFIKEITLFGLFFVLIFSFLLSQVDHVIFEGRRK